MIIAAIISASMAPSEVPEPVNKFTACIPVGEKLVYKTESDQKVRLTLGDGRIVVMALDKSCPNLHFHGFMRFTPTNGQLCANIDQIQTRTGYRCSIESFSAIPPK